MWFTVNLESAVGSAQTAPCRITPESPKGVCGATADSMVARNFLRAVAAGSACYLHVAEATARRLNSIAEGTSPLPLRSEKSVDALASMLGIEGIDVKTKALGIARSDSQGYVPAA